MGCESSDYICESLVQIYISFLMQVGVIGLGVTEGKDLDCTEFRDTTIFGANSGIEARSCVHPYEVQQIPSYIAPSPQCSSTLSVTIT